MPYNRHHPAVHMLIATFFFALMNVSIKFVSHIPAFEIILFRAMITLVISYVMIRNLGINPLGNHRKTLMMRGFFGMLALVTFFFTVQKLPLASAVTLQYLSPIFTVLFAVFYLKEKVQPIQWVCFAVAFAGVAIIRGFDARLEAPYLLLGILSAMFSGLAYNSVRKLKDTDHPLVVVFYFPLVSLPFALVYCLFKWVTPAGWDWLWLLLIGLFTQIAQVNLTHALQNEKLAAISGLNYLGIIYALFFGYVFFDETYDWIVLLGIFLVLTGVMLNFFLRKS
ncbi:MAG TPA: DMT family transporter [Chitinophagales bacterium]|nr:DMT family transporter [Chitinophagales bacterium]